MTKIYVFGKPVGLVEDGVFIKRVNGAVHFLRIPPAICMDARSLEKAEDAGAKEIKIIDKRDNSEYTASIRFFCKEAFTLNRGYGEQLALPIEKWSRKDPHQKSFI